MSASLIINARSRLSWHQRFVSDASTAFMWAFWIKLWLPVLRAMLRVPFLDALARKSLRLLLVQGSAQSVEHYALALVGASGSLLVWSRLPAFKVATPELTTPQDCAAHFGLPLAELLAGREASVCVVHHDESGRILRLERRAPAPTP